MYSKRPMSNVQKIEMLKDIISDNDVIVIGAGAGLSTSAGLSYSGERFEKHFGDFIKKYNLTDMYSAGFHHYKTVEEYWAYWSRHIYHNRYEDIKSNTYKNLYKLLENKEYFVITTNVDHLFQKNGFDKERLFYTQGDYGLWQCAVPCHKKTYENEKEVHLMIKEQIDMKIPKKLIPHCPVCGDYMTMNLRVDNTFVEDDGWHKAHNRYQEFLKIYGDKKILFLELGVGQNTPSIIKYPFWQMVYKNDNAFLVSINKEKENPPKELAYKSLYINEDISVIFEILT